MWCDAGFRSLLPEAAWQGLLSVGTRRTYAAGEPLMIEGDETSSVFVIVGGRVKVTCNEEDGMEVLLAIRGAGDLVGERAAIDQGTRSATVTALCPCTAQVLAAGAFLRFVEEHRLESAVMRFAVARQREGQRIRVELTTLPVHRRLVRTLLRLIEALGGGQTGPIKVDLGLSQDELARAIGASRSQVTGCLQALRNDGVVETGHRHVVVLDPERLRALDAART